MGMQLTPNLLFSSCCVHFARIFDRLQTVMQLTVDLVVSPLLPSSVSVLQLPSWPQVLLNMAMQKRRILARVAEPVLHQMLPRPTKQPASPRSCPLPCAPQGTASPALRR